MLANECKQHLSGEVCSKEPPDLVLHKAISSFVIFNGLHLVDDGGPDDISSIDAAEEYKNTNVDVGEDVLGHEREAPEEEWEEVGNKASISRCLPGIRVPVILRHHIESWHLPGVVKDDRDSSLEECNDTDGNVTADVLAWCANRELAFISRWCVVSHLTYDSSLILIN